MKSIKPSPVTVAVLISFGLAVVALIFGGALIGNYLLTEHYVHAFYAHEQMLQATAARAARAASLKSAEGTCRAVQAMDNASKGVKFAPPVRTGVPTVESYGFHLSSAIHNLYVHSGCAALLSPKKPG